MLVRDQEKAVREAREAKTILEAFARESKGVSGVAFSIDLAVRSLVDSEIIGGEAYTGSGAYTGRGASGAYTGSGASGAYTGSGASGVSAGSAASAEPSTKRARTE